MTGMAEPLIRLARAICRARIRQPGILKNHVPITEKEKTGMKYPLLIFLISCLLSAKAQPGQMLGEAEVLSAAGRYQASNALLDEFIEANPTRMYDQGEALFLKSYNNLQLGNLEAALADNTASLELRQQFIPEDAAKNYMRYGAIYLLEGQYERALDYLFRSEEFPLIDDPQTAALIKGYIGNAYADLTQYERARKYYQQSLDILLIEEGEEIPDVSTSYYHIGRTFLLEGKPGMAREWLEKALAIEKELEGGVVRKGQLCNAMGQVEEEEGGLQKAREYYQLAIEGYRELHSTNHRELARSLINLAELKLRMEDSDGARKDIQEALRQLCPGFEGRRFEDNPGEDALVLSRPLLAQALEVKAAILLEAYERQQQPASLEQALAAGRRAAAALEEEAALLGLETSRLNLLEEQTSIYEMGITAAYKLYQHSGNLTYAEQAFELSERAKALLLRLNCLNRQGLQQLPAEVQEEEARHRYALKAAEVAFALHPDEPRTQQELAGQRQAYRSLMEKIRSSAPSYFAQRFASETATPQQLQEKLGDKQALLSYFLGAGHYFIFALTKDNFRIFRLNHELARAEAPAGEWGALFPKGLKKGTGIGVYSKLDVKLKLPPLPNAIEGYLRAIRKVDSQQFSFYSHNLYSQLLFPAKSLLEDKDELIIIPHGRLSYIPFEALLSASADKPEKSRYQKYDYLIEDFTIQYHHSASLYALPVPEHRYGEGLLGIAPVFDDQAANGAVWSSSEFAFDTTYQQSVSLRAAVPDGQRFVPLHFSETEMSGILEQFGKKGRPAVALLRAEATEEAFRQQAGRYRYLHLATHSFLNEANPALSGIAFAQPEESGAEDGILYSAEIAGLALRAELAVLSSCESGIGPLSEGEGPLSLSRSFLEAGVPNVVASLWKVYDRYTAEMMAPFYKELLKGESPAGALRQAKLKMIRKKATAAPRIWSGMILFGGG